MFLGIIKNQKIFFSVINSKFVRKMRARKKVLRRKKTRADSLLTSTKVGFVVLKRIPVLIRYICHLIRIYLTTVKISIQTF